MTSAFAASICSTLQGIGMSIAAPLAIRRSECARLAKMRPP